MFMFIILIHSIIFVHLNEYKLLISASKKGNIKLVEIILFKGANVDVIDEDKRK